MGIYVEQTVYEVLPTGEYPASINQIEEVEGQFGDQLKFEFAIQGGEHDGTTLLGWASKKFSNKSKLYKWTKAAFGADIPPNYDFDSDDLLDRKIVLTVVVNTKDDGSEFNRIETVRPGRGNGKSDGDNVSPPPPPPLSEDEFPW